MSDSEVDIRASAEVLRLVSIFLRNLTPEEIQSLVAGESRISLSDRTRKKTAPTPVPDDAIQAIVDSLKGMDSREEGYTLLVDAALTRAQLAQVCDAFDIPVRKADNVSMLKERIIEASIGFRLRSEAIRGKLDARE